MNARSAAIARENAQIEASTQRAIAAREAQKPAKMTAMESLAARLDVSPGSLQETLTQTVFKGCTKAEFVALVIVSNTYNLNPLLREIYAFPKKGGGIQAIVGYDGWIKIANNHPQYDGFESDHIEDREGNLKAIEGILYRKDRSHPTKKLVYLKEFKRNTDPWNNAPHHMLDVRCFCQTVRLALGIPLGVEGIDDINVAGEVAKSDAMILPSAVDFAAEVQQSAGRDTIDAETGEVMERDPRTGMTEVDEETARQLDANDGTLSPDNPTAAEGRADEHHGDQHDDDRPTLAQATTYIKEAGTIIDLNSRFNEVSGFFEGDELLALTDDKADRAKALKGGK
jgi:hypothetical protein